MVLGFGLGVLIALLARDHLRSSTESSTWQVLVGIVVSSAGLVLGVVAIIVIVRRGRWGQRYRSPTAALSRKQRRHLLAQVRGREPVDPARLALARDLALRLEEQLRLLAPLYLALVLLNLGNVILRRDAFHYAIAGVFVVLFLAIVVAGYRQAEQGRRFLEENPAPED